MINSIINITISIKNFYIIVIYSLELKLSNCSTSSGTGI